MPSGRLSAFKGGGGILRGVDCTITDLQFTDQKAVIATSKPRPGVKKSDFHSLWANLSFLVDGAEAPVTQSVFVGDADAFEVVCDGRGLGGDGQLSKSSGWFVLYNSLVAAGFDENLIPDDPTVADYTAIVGARVRTDWQVNEALTKKLGKRAAMKDGKAVKGRDGKPVSYDREDLVITAYHGQVEVEDGQVVANAKPTAGKASTKPTTSGKTKTAPPPPEPEDISERITDIIIDAVTTSKTKSLTKSKLSVVVMQALKDEDGTLIDEARAWAFDDANLAGIDGLSYDKAKKTLSLG